MTRRSKSQIIFDILELLRKNKADEIETRPTHIMYGANLSFIMSNNYLTFLQGSDLINKIQKKSDNDIEYTVYEISEKGYNFLKRVKPAFKEMEELLSKFK
jgi:predicted transcriptional regulator